MFHVRTRTTTWEQSVGAPHLDLWVKFASSLTDHLQGVHVYVAAHYPSLGVQLGAAQADGHADLPVAVAADRQAALTFQPAGRPSAGVKTAVKAAEVQLNNAGGLSHEQNVLRCKHRLNTTPALKLVTTQTFFFSTSLSSFKCLFFKEQLLFWLLQWTHFDLRLFSSQKSILRI